MFRVQQTHAFRIRQAGTFYLVLTHTLRPLIASLPPAETGRGNHINSWINLTSGLIPNQAELPWRCTGLFGGTVLLRLRRACLVGVGRQRRFNFFFNCFQVISNPSQMETIRIGIEGPFCFVSKNPVAKQLL